MFPAGSVIACYFRFVIDRTAILDRFLASAFERRATVLDLSLIHI